MARIRKTSLAIDVRDYASDVVGCSPDRITAVSRFEDGNRHAVYKVSFLETAGATKDLVVRVSFAGDPDDCAQTEREARVLNRVGGHAAPLLYDFRCTSRWFDTPTMCMQFLLGRQQELCSTRSAEIERLGSVIGWIHGQPAGDLVEGLATTTNDLASYADGRLQSILSGMAWVRDPLPAPIQARLKGAADSLERELELSLGAEGFRSGETLALLHGDIATDNILWGPDPVLIDWEYTRLGDPADEIAYLFDQNSLAAPHREAFWRGYRESISSPLRLAHVISRVNWWEPVTLLGSTLWWVERWVRRTDADAAGESDRAVPREQGYYFDRVISRLNRLDKLISRE
jgi:Ser/Thr protein kinase RdoA (MazF antagonist)